VSKSRTLAEFDKHFIAPVYGFTDDLDYYEKTSSKRQLNNIKVPTIVINAIDDPLIDAATLPNEEDLLDDCPVKLIYQTHGGHCGFYSHQSALQGEAKQHGWLAEELARGLEHIDQKYMQSIFDVKIIEEYTTTSSTTSSSSSSSSSSFHAKNDVE
jgi:predicted alpha/beta-fold hydrolase